MTTIYSAYQYEKCYPPGVENHWWTLGRNRLLADILRRECSPADQLLEVGCGKGVVVRGLRDYGFEVRGVELAEVEPVEGAQAYVDVGVDACDLPAERRAQVTGLLLLDVIEHLPDPEQFLRRLEASFPNVSMILVTVPTCEEIWTNYDVFSGHYRRYTLETLEQLFAALDWTCGQRGYFFRISYLPMRLMAMLGMDRETFIRAPGPLMRPLHRLVAQVCRWEQAMAPRRLRGSSAFAVCRPGRERHP